jgi:alpha-beta hydrolase superfamily lysophospholipase
MIAAARRIREELKNAPLQLPLLITQGLCDPVCPPEYLHALLKEAPLPHLTLHEFPEALHEPFVDETREELFHQITSWLANESIV